MSMWFVSVFSVLHDMNLVAVLGSYTSPVVVWVVWVRWVYNMYEERVWFVTSRQVLVGVATSIGYGFWAPLKPSVNTEQIE